MNRRQGSGMLTVGLQAIAVAPYDVIDFSYAPYGWVNKQLQVTSWQLCSDTGAAVPRWYIQLGVREYDPTDLSWSTTEELTILDQPVAAQFESEIAAVPEFTLNTGPGYDIVNGDGVLIPRVEVVWSDPPDVRVTMIDVQWTPHGAAGWKSISPTPVGVGVTYFTGPVAGEFIDVRIRSLAGTAESTWLEADNFAILVSSISTITSIGTAPGIPWNVTNDATIDSIAGTGASAGSAIIRIYGTGGVGTPFNVYTGWGSYQLPAATLVAPYSTAGYVTEQVNSTFYVGVGGAIHATFPTPTYSFTTNYTATIGDEIVMIGAATTIASSGSGGTTGGGGSGGGGTGGPRGGACTAEGTLLDTPDGPVSNIILAHQHALGLPTYLSGADGKPERIVRAEWVWQARHQVLEVGEARITCSDSHTVGIEGAHKASASIASGTAIDTRTGPQTMTRTPMVGDVRVLKLTMEGPSHIYSASGVLTHNEQKSNTE